MRHTNAYVNSFSRDSKIASFDLFPIIICGVRAAARLMPRIKSISHCNGLLPFHDMVD